MNILLSRDLDVSEKKALLENEFAIPMTKEMDEAMETMENQEYWFEAAARRKLLYELVGNGDLSAIAAAKALNIPESQFLADMNKAQAVHTV